ncbi:hypothetical protein C0993_006656, partial [Termitomyces sp. T159_Od127]
CKNGLVETAWTWTELTELWEERETCTRSKLSRLYANTTATHEEPLLYQTPVYVQMDMDEEEHYEYQAKERCYEHMHQPRLSQAQALVQLYVCIVAQPPMEEYVPQVQMSMGTEALLHQLEAAGQPVPATAMFLQDDLAVMVMEGLLNQIELTRKQCVTVPEQIDHIAKCKMPPYEGASVVLKQAKPQPPWPVKVA